MRAWRVSCVLLIGLGCVAPCGAQDLPMHKGAWGIGGWAGGGTGIGHSTDFQFANAALRLSRVMTAEHGPGLLRGNFECAVDIAPVYVVFQNGAAAGSATSRQAVYGGALSPVIWKWNFTRGRRLAPFAAAEGTAILSGREVPAGNTSLVNFGSGIASGVQIVRGNRRTVTFSGHLLHISNASIGDRNPSINIGLHFRLGYEWWR
jgi:hypothetical protein